MDVTDPRRALLPLAIAASLLSGCYLSHLFDAPERGEDAAIPRDSGVPPRPEDSGPPPADAGVEPLDAFVPTDTGVTVEDATVPGCDGEVRETVETRLALDLLFLVDNSGSMEEEQALIANEFPRLVRALVTGDLDADGAADFPPVRDMHVGIVTSDMGTYGSEVPTCDLGAFGEDGVLRNRRGLPRRGCDTIDYPRFLDFQLAEGDSEEQLVADFTCIEMVGTDGCAMEQQLEAVLKALTPSTSAIRFHGGTVGHGDGANAGFLRDDSILTIVLVTDEDDCSARDPDVYSSRSTRYEGGINNRCVTYEAEALHPITRYVNGFRALRREHPDRFLVASIVGVPPDLVEGTESVDYGAILADERMQIRPHPIFDQLLPSCSVRSRGEAYPPRRIVALARALGEDAIVQSICQERFDFAVRAIVERLGTTIRRVGCGGEEIVE